MKLTTFAALLAVVSTSALSAQATGALRVGCEYGPTTTPSPTTETPAPTTETPAPTTETPAPTTTTPAPEPTVPGPPAIEVFDANNNLIYSRSVLTAGKCITWTNCFSDRLETVTWQKLGAAGTSITFFGNEDCENRGTVVSFRATAPQTVHNADAEDFQLAEMKSFVVLDAQTSQVDGIDGCVPSGWSP